MSEQPSTKKKKWYIQTFKKEWLQDPELKYWLRQDSTNPDASCCSCCNIQLKNANKSMLFNHKNTKKHKKCFEIAKSNVKNEYFLKKRMLSEGEEVAKVDHLEPEPHDNADQSDTFEVIHNLHQSDSNETLQNIAHSNTCETSQNESQMKIQSNPVLVKPSYSTTYYVSKSPKLTATSERLASITGAATTPLKNITQSSCEKYSENEFDIFARNVAIHLKKLPLFVALESQSYIQDYLIKRRLEHTKPGSSSVCRTPGSSTPEDSMLSDDHSSTKHEESNNVIRIVNKYL